MREEELLPAVHSHLGTFPLRLQDRVTVTFDYTPMPPMAYAALKGELWCYRYYLRKLCSPEHAAHPLVEHVRFRNVRLASHGVFVFFPVVVVRAAASACQSSSGSRCVGTLRSVRRRIWRLIDRCKHAMCELVPFHGGCKHSWWRLVPFQWWMQ